MSHYSSPFITSPCSTITKTTREGESNPLVPYITTVRITNGNSITINNKDGNSTPTNRHIIRPPLSPSPLLQWTAGRRVASEPANSVAGLVDSGRSSLTSYGSQESLFSISNDSDVFSDCYSEEEDDDEDIKEIYESYTTGYLNKWKEWTVYSNDIQLSETVIQSSCKETVQRGYWHGAVWVHKRTIQQQEDIVSFAHEVNTLCRIRHENIQLFMGVCLDLPDDTFGIIMSEVKGETLYTHLHKYGHNFTTPSKLKILRQLSEGMEYLHAKGICHGGLSSKLITIQHRVCISLSFHTMNHRQLEGFDLPYLPPDEVRSVSLLPPKGHLYVPGRPTSLSDIFAFGTLTYELANLKMPFKNSSLLDLVWNVGNRKCQSLSFMPRSCFKSIISRCWSLTRVTTFKDILSTILRDDTSFSRYRSPTSISNDLLCTVRQ